MVSENADGGGNDTAAPSNASAAALSATACTCSSSSSTPLPPAPDTAWYVDATMRRRPAAACNGPSTGMNAMVVQFGLATMPFGIDASESSLTSVTTSGTSGSMRQADELSITTAPAAATRGASSRDADAPLENSATSSPSNDAVAESSTSISPPFHGSRFPAERADAKKRMDAIGKSRSSSNVRMTPPTWPVAPKTPTFTPTLISRLQFERFVQRLQRVLGPI